jgi:rRNA-processing protein Efg1
MGTKRSHDAMAGNAIHPDRQGIFPRSSMDPKKKSRYSKPLPLSADALPAAVNRLKKKVRDLNRLLNREGEMAADVRRENERALAAYTQELEAAETERRKMKMSKKYHMVRFFGMLKLF